MSADVRPRRWRRRSALLIAVLGGLLIGYPLSIGPICWTIARINPVKHQIPVVALCRIYQPVSEGIILSPDWLRPFANDWIALGLPRDVQLETQLKDGIVWSGPGYTYTLLYLKLGRDE
jgi:hypothetical protein